MANNCRSQLQEVRQRFDVVKTTSCSSFLDPASASAAATLLCAEVIADGAIPGETGHKTVNNWRDTPFGRIPLPNTYVGYCAGNRVA